MPTPGTPRYGVDFDGLNPQGTTETQNNLFNLGLEQTPTPSQTPAPPVFTSGLAYTES